MLEKIGEFVMSVVMLLLLFWGITGHNLVTGSNYAYIIKCNDSDSEFKTTNHSCKKIDYQGFRITSADSSSHTVSVYTPNGDLNVARNCKVKSRTNWSCTLNEDTYASFGPLGSNGIRWPVEKFYGNGFQYEYVVEYLGLSKASYVAPFKGIMSSLLETKTHEWGNFLKKN